MGDFSPTVRKPKHTLTNSDQPMAMNALCWEFISWHVSKPPCEIEPGHDRRRDRAYLIR
tara:strand:+ start:291 stop:467 length:177 start_codon:yes stop_codon:yes gene_type:complete